MKGIWVIIIGLVGLLILGGVVYAHGWMPWMRGAQGYLGPMMGWHCPMMQYMMGYQSYRDYQNEPLTKNDAQRVGEDYLLNWNNPNLKLGKIKETEHEFEIEIVTKDNSLVEKLLLDKHTGWLRIAH